MTPAELTASRTQLGLSQAGLSRALGVDRATVSKWESGQHPIPVHIALAMEALHHRTATIRRD